MRPTRCLAVVKEMAGAGTAASMMAVPHIGSAAFAEASRRDGDVSWRSTHGPHAASPRSASDGSRISVGANGAASLSQQWLEISSKAA